VSLRPCLVCGTPSHGPRCPAHTIGGFARFDRSRQNAYRGTWPAIRKQVLEEEPICRICRAAPSVEADDILPVRLGGQSTRANARGVCRRCNLRRAAEASAVVRRARGRGVGSRRKAPFARLHSWLGFFPRESGAS
jgi:5-methylcytosine-specific restriction endonuclease McrA